MAWQISDILEYERFLWKENAVPEEERRRTRRAWFRETRCKSTDSARNRRRVLREWLESMRSNQSAGDRGLCSRSIYNFIFIFLAVSGLIAGAGLTCGVLAYTGDHAINIGVAVGFLVLFPLVLSICSAVFAVLPIRSRPDVISVVLKKILAGIIKLLETIRILTKEHARDVRGVLIRILDRSTHYGRLGRNLRTQLLQWSGLGANTGIFLALYLCGTFKDLAFCWQTTGAGAPETLHAWVRFFAWPWQWSGFGVPTLGQVEESRVFLSQGIADLDAAALQSWWIYLLLLVFFYGVVLRLILLLGAGAATQVSLWKLRFNDGESGALFKEMVSPSFGVEGEEPPASKATRTKVGEASVNPSHELIVLIPDFRTDLQSDSAWQQLPQFKGIQDVQSISMDDEDDRVLLLSLAKRMAEAGTVLLLVEGFHPYTAETGLYIEVLREILPAGVSIKVGLISDERGVQTISALEFEEWRHRIAAGKECRGIEVLRVAVRAD